MSWTGRQSHPAWGPGGGAGAAAFRDRALRSPLPDQHPTSTAWGQSLPVLLIISRDACHTLVRWDSPFPTRGDTRSKVFLH